MKSNHKKPRICIALPGTDYLPNATLMFANTEPLLPYLDKYFDVTVVFRKTGQIPAQSYKYSTILDQEKLSKKERKDINTNFTPVGRFVWRYKIYESLRQIC